MGEESAKRRATTGPTKPRKRKKIDYSKYTQIDMAGVGVSDSQPLVAQEQTSLEPMDSLSSTGNPTPNAGQGRRITFLSQLNKCNLQMRLKIPESE